MKSFAPALLPVLIGVNAAAATVQPVLPDGTYRYEVRIGGHAVGTSTIVIHREGAVIVIGESAAVAGLSLVSERRIEESTFATLSYTAQARGNHVSVTISGNEATLRQGGTTKNIVAAPDAPFVVSENLVAGWAQTAATLHATGEKKVTLACVCGSDFIAVRVTVANSASGIASLTGSDGVALTLSFDPKTYVLTRLDVPAQQASVVLQSQDPRVLPLPHPVEATPVPLPPARYTSRDVTIRTDDGVLLAGTLTIPEAAATPLPGFVFVHGSGCLDRDETIGPNKIFGQLANRLSNDGYAVLRYDKRSCGSSGGSFAPRNRLIADAREAIAFLRSQRGIDPSRIFVLGHSEGGELVPSVAIADGRLRGIVLLAPPALPLEQILLQQLVRTATPANRAALEQQDRIELDAIASGKKTGAYDAWLRSSFGIDPAAIIADVPCPILIVQGMKDIQVLPSDTPRLVNAARAANRELSVTMLPGDDHIFIRLASGEDSTGVEYYVPSYLDPALFTAIETWLRSR
jgi:uncharacterized protein